MKTTQTIPRIAVFFSSLAGGGAERVMVNLCHSFRETGLHVDLVLSSSHALDLYDINSQIRIVDLKAPRGVSSSLPALIKYLRQESPLALISNLHFANEVALMAKFLAGVATKIILVEHNVMSREIRHETTRMRRLIIPFCLKYLYRFANDIVAVSEGVATDLAQMTGLPQKRIQVIYNPVITPELKEHAQEPVDHPWFAPGEPPVILGVGRLDEQKDFPTLIRAFAQVRRLRNSKLVILGWGLGRPQLEALVEELGLSNNVSMPGHVKNPYAYMAKSAVFVLSSAWEGLGNVLIEVMATGCPVVSTNCKSGPAEILDNGKYGFLTPVGDSEFLAKAILEVLSGNLKAVDADWLDQFSLKFY